MENLHDQLKEYIPKLEKSIVAYMTGTPPTPNSAQGITAMVTCLELLKKAERESCSELDRSAAEMWVSRMENEDGSTGAHWSMEQTTALGDGLGLSWESFSPWCWWVTVNMMWSDYYSVASHFGVATPDFFAELARAFLCDKDAVGAKEKLSAYYCGIVRPQM